MFSSQNILITGGNFSQFHHVKAPPLEQLKDATSSAAFHNSAARFDAPKCHPNTRLAVLNRIMQWILGNEHSDELIMWLYGSAGAGKSAIAQSIAELCVTDRILLASFFFSRTDSTRNHAKFFISTLAYQIASKCPEARGMIEAMIEENPLVLSLSIETQLELLIIGPLRRIFETTPTRDGLPLPRSLIIIDGLDECQDSAVRCIILKAIASTLTRQHGHLPLIFLITSRPEQDITMTFSEISTIPEERRVVTPLALDDSYGASADIEVFLRDKFNQIRSNHPLKSIISPSWPSDAVVQQLVAKSSGQFIYVSTVVKYVQSNRHSPMERLEVVLGLRSRYDSSLPFAELDALYTQIFSSVEEEDIELVYDILALMMIPQASTNVNDMEKFLSLSPGRILLLFANLSSIISCPPDYLESRDDSYCHIHERPREYLGLSFLHASLPDFLLDEARSKHLFINPTLRNTRMLDYCIHHLQIDPFAPLRYVERHIDHFCSMAAPTADLHQKIWNFSFLQHRDNALHHVVYSVNLMENFLSGIKKSKFEDADQMYNHHLKQFDQFWMSILLRFFTKENPQFDFLLIFAQYGLHWRVSLNSVGESMRPEDLVKEFYKGQTLRRIPSFSTQGGFTIDVNSPFWRLLEDPSRSGEYTIDGAKYATTALTYFKCIRANYHVPDRIIIHLGFILDRSAKSDELVDWALGWHCRRARNFGSIKETSGKRLGEATVDYLRRNNALPSSYKMTREYETTVAIPAPNLF